MKFKKILILLILFLIMSTYFPLRTNAEEAIIEIEKNTIERPAYVETENPELVGDITVSNDEITMIAKTSNVDSEEIIIEKEYGYTTYYMGLCSELYYRYNNDIEKLNKVNLKQYFIEKGVDLIDSLIKITNIYVLNEKFYLEISIEYNFYKGDNRNCKHLILEVNSETGFREVGLPNNSTEIMSEKDNQTEKLFTFMYNGNFVLAWERI